MATGTKVVEVRQCDRCGKHISRRSVVDAAAGLVFKSMQALNGGADESADPDLCGPCERSVVALGARILKAKKRGVTSA